MEESKWLWGVFIVYTTKGLYADCRSVSVRLFERVCKSVTTFSVVMVYGKKCLFDEGALKCEKEQIVRVCGHILRFT